MMIKRVALGALVGVALSLAACGDARFDTTDETTQRESLREMHGDMSATEKERFAKALTFLLEEEQYVLDLVDKSALSSTSLKGLMEDKGAEDIIMIAESARRKKVIADTCAALERITTSIVNYAARQYNRTKIMPLADQVFGALSLASRQERIGGENVVVSDGLSFFIYSEDDRKTVAVMHNGCIDRVGAPKVAFWDFLNNDQTVWY